MNPETIKPLIYTVLSAALFILCDSAAAHWGKSLSTRALVITIILSPLGYLFFGMLNASKSLASSSGIVNLLILLGNLAVSILLFHEVISLKQVCGVVLAVIAIFLLT
jgi:drug/metabolite transporter (DMT)-like permease